MVTGGYAVDAQIEKLCADAWGDAKTMGCVLAVDDHNIGVQVLADMRHEAGERVAPGLSHHIANMNNVFSKVRKIVYFSLL